MTSTGSEGERVFYRKFMVMVCAGLATLALAARPAQAAARFGHPLRYIAFQYAFAQRGKWYCWGGIGPSCFDCSGLIYVAYRRLHIPMPRTTYEMLASRLLVRISKRQARRGDLAFYGPEHVELVAGANVTFGAHAPGQRISKTFDSGYWHPTAYYRVRGGG